MNVQFRKLIHSYETDGAAISCDYAGRFRVFNGRIHRNDGTVEVETTVCVSSRISPEMEQGPERECVGPKGKF